jgi:hypothetical protein
LCIGETTGAHPPGRASLEGSEKAADMIIMSKALQYPVVEKIVITLATAIAFSILVFPLVGLAVLKLFFEF